MNQGIAFAAVCACRFYAIKYGVLYHLRCPATNLSYWAYSERTEDWAEKCLYYGFYPAYFVHQRVLGGQRHNYDRPEPWFPQADAW